MHTRTQAVLEEWRTALVAGGIASDELAGIIPEPTAAVLALVQDGTINLNTAAGHLNSVLIVDIGGGTTDLSGCTAAEVALGVQKHLHLKVMATAGNRVFGVLDLRHAIVEGYLAALPDAGGLLPDSLRVMAGAVAEQLIREACQRPDDEDALYTREVGSSSAPRMAYSWRQISALPAAAGWRSNLRQCVLALLQDARANGDVRFDTVACVGGGSLVPPFRAALREVCLEQGLPAPTFAPVESACNLVGV
jgi:hypothetical protein